MSQHNLSIFKGHPLARSDMKHCAALLTAFTDFNRHRHHVPSPLGVPATARGTTAHSGLGEANFDAHLTFSITANDINTSSFTI